MHRGDIVIAPDDFGKSRPAVVIQGDALNRAEPGSTIVALVTSTLQDAPLLPLTLQPTPENGLKSVSQIKTNRIVTLRTKCIGCAIGRLDHSELVELNRLLALAIGLT